MPDTVKINQPTPTQLTRLTILLAGHRPSFAGSTSRFILMGEAQKLWIMCAALLRSGFGLRPDEKFSKITVEEIATLAATLGHGADEKVHYGTLARDALTLWIDSRTARFLVRECGKLRGYGAAFARTPSPNEN